MKRIIYPLFLCALLGPAWATLPSSISFQAYLTDRDGSPQEGSTLITFSIYTVEVGGSPQWWDTLNVDIESGLLSVELGRPANPFPADLFETPLWLGITVEADDEMIPRRALRAVGFSFKSEDANSVQGKSAADLDQSAHTDNLANPHDVTAAQAGAADQAILDAHTGDTANPHQTTAALTGATDAAVFLAHAADASAHHSRYSDAESMAAVLSSDGSGSGLDADTVDGVDGATLQASVVANSSAIDALAVISQSNSDTIATLNSGLVVKANAQPIGNYLDGGGFNATVISSTGYSFVLELGGDGRMSETPLAYAQPNCQGIPTMDPLSPWGSLQGEVRKIADGLFYYYPPGAPGLFYVAQSTFSSGDGCQTANGTVGTHYEAFPNDPAITGVPNSDFTPPITLGN